MSEMTLQENQATDVFVLEWQGIISWQYVGLDEVDLQIEVERGYEQPWDEFMAECRSQGNAPKIRKISVTLLP